MTKSKFVIDKLAKLFEQGLISYKDLSSEIINILRSKRDEIVFRMRLASKDETDILINRVENLEKKIEKIEKVNKNSLKRKPIKVRKS
jgi:hypothetical protein